MSNQHVPLVARFKAKYEVAASGCWQWTGHTWSNGYGCIKNDKKGRLAHRVAYELFIGPIPTGLEIDHLCRNRACVNPAHLEAVTHRENLLRGETLSAKAAAKTHCPSGHPYDELNTYHWRGNRLCRRCR